MKDCLKKRGKMLRALAIACAFSITAIFAEVTPVAASVGDKASLLSATGEAARLTETEVTITVGFTHEITTESAFDKVEWNISDTSVLSAKRTAKHYIIVEALKTGTAIVTGTLEDGTVLTCNVTVKANQYETAMITGDQVPSGKWGAEAYEVSYTGISGWENLEVKVRVVNNTGRTITGLKNIAIEVKHADGDKYAAYTQNREIMSLKSGESKTLTFTIDNSNLDSGKGYMSTIIYELETDIKSVTFSAEAWGLSGTSGVKNTAIPALSRSDVTVYINKSYTLKVTNSDKKAKWSSSNKKVATVSSTGKVKGKSAGNAIITAKVGKTTLKCRVVVAYPGAESSSYRLTITNKITGSAKSKCSESKYLVMYWGENMFYVNGDCENVTRLKAVIECACGLEFTQNTPFKEHQNITGHGRGWIMYNAYTFTLKNNKTATITGLKKSKGVRICRIYDSEPTGIRQTLAYSYNNAKKKSMGEVCDVNWSDGITNLSLGLQKNSSLVIYNTVTAIKKYDRYSFE
jgi:hypothetical protein